MSTDVVMACNPVRLGFQGQSWSSHKWSLVGYELMVTSAVVWLEQREEVDDRAPKGTRRGTTSAQGLLEALA